MCVCVVLLVKYICPLKREHNYGGCINAHTHTHLYMYRCICICIFIYVYMCVCMCVCVVLLLRYFGPLKRDNTTTMLTV